MAGIRKSKKKRFSKRLFIAIGAAAFIGLMLLLLMNANSNRQSELSRELQDKNQKIVDLQNQNVSLEEDVVYLKRELEKRNVPLVNKVKDTVSVVVAKNDILPGARLSYSDLELKEWPQEAVPSGVSEQLETLLGRMTSDKILSGEPVLNSYLIDKNIKYLSVPEGYRAMTFPVDSITGVAGHIMPGAKVDILTILPKSAGNNSRTGENISKILLQDVKVLAASELSDNKKKSSASSVTVAVPADDIVKLALAYNKGQGYIQVVLKSFQDTSSIAKTSINTSELVADQIVVEDSIELPDVNLVVPPEASYYSSGKFTDLNSIISDTDDLPVPVIPETRTKTHSVEFIQANSRQELTFETEI